MPRFYIVNENSEDTFEPANNLEEAVRLAREIASQREAGDPISVLESGGLAVRQFVRMADGTVAEQVMARQAGT